MKVDESGLKRYANQLKHGKEFKSMNLVEYISKFHVKATKLSQRKKPVIVGTFSIFVKFKFSLLSIN